MPKRFTDTEKWRDEWWGSLDNDYRMIWLYLVDSCSIAGIWKKDFRGLNFNCNTKITEEDFMKVFKSRVMDRAHFYFMPKFLTFQYPKGLNSNKPAIISVVKELRQYSLLQTVNQLFGNDYLIVKDKDKDTDKDKDKDKDKRKDKDRIKTAVFSDQIWFEQLSMTHKGKDINQAFDECWNHWTQSDTQPSDEKEWRRKLNTWLGNMKFEKSNGYAPGKFQQ